MADAKRAWDEVGKGFVDLGATLRSHFGDRGDRPVDADPDAGEHPDGAGVSDEVRSALQQLAVALEGAFDAVGRAAKDPEVNAEVRSVGQSLASALATSFAEVGEEVKRAFSRSERTDAPTDQSPPPHPDDTPSGE